MRSSDNINWEKHKVTDWETHYYFNEEDKKNEIIKKQLDDLYSPMKFFVEDCKIVENKQPIYFAKKITVFLEDTNQFQQFIDKLLEFTEKRYNALEAVLNTRYEFVLTADDLNSLLENSLQKKNSSQNDLPSQITNKINFYRKSKENAEKSSFIFGLDSHLQLCDHNIRVLEDTKLFLAGKISINDFLLSQHTHFRWVEGKEPRELVEEAIKTKLKDISPVNLALSAKIAKKINEYQKNIQSENNSFFPDEDKIELWKHKVKVLQHTQILLHDNNKFDSAAFEKLIEHKHRWAEGKETTALVEEMKRLKKVPEEIIALDTKISRQISTYKRKYEDAHNSIFSFNREENKNLWKAKIEILEVAKSVLYDSDQQQTMALMMSDAKWSKGKVAKALVDEVYKLHQEGKTLTLDQPKFNPNRDL